MEKELKLTTMPLEEIKYWLDKWSRLEISTVELAGFLGVRTWKIRQKEGKQIAPAGDNVIYTTLMEDLKNSTGRAGYALYRTYSEKRRRLRHSMFEYEYYSDPRNRERHSKIMNEYNKNHPEQSEKISRGLRAMYARNPDAAAKRGEKQRERFSDPLERQRQSEISKQVMSNPRVRIKISTSLKKFYEDPEEREKLRIREKSRFEDPKERKRQSELSKKALNDPIVRKRLSDAQIRRFEDPAERERMGRTIASRFDEPGYRENWSLKMKKMHRDNPSVRVKIMETRRKNKTLNSSSSEDSAKASLLQIFSEDDLSIQYRSPEYPFMCDFYIKSLDLYIECDFFWSHGKHAFNRDDPEDIVELNRLYEKAKTSKFYANILENWVVRDPLKIWHQRKNNLNFLRFYSTREFNAWLMENYPNAPLI